MNDTLINLPIEQVHPDPDNPRKTFDPEELQELAASIAAIGLEQPVTLRPGEKGGYILIAGERRYRAHLLLGLPTIQAIVRTDIDTDTLVLRQVVENLQRADLNPMDEARGFRSAMDRLGLNQSQLAAELGIQRTRIAKALALLRMAPSVKEALAAGAITAGHADAIGILDHEGQAAAVETITTQRLSVAATRRELQQAATSACAMPHTPDPADLQRAPTPDHATSHTPITARPRHRVLQVLVKAAEQLQHDQTGLTSADLEALRQVASILASLVS